MCSNLFLIPSHVAGVPLFGLGVLFWLSLLGFAAWGAWALRRPTGRGEVLAAVPFVGVLAVGLLLLPRIFPEGFPVRGYGTMLIVAAVSGLAMANRRARQAGLHPDLILSLAFWMFVCGIVGGRVFYVVQKWPDMYAQLPLQQALLEAVKYAKGGLVVYGALIGAAVAFTWFVRRHRLPWLAMADLIAPSLMVGLACGRIGCLLHGCCFGGVSDAPWAVTFPQQGEPVYSPPYEAQLARGEFFGFRLVPREGQLVVDWVKSDSPATQQGLAVGDEIVQLGEIRQPTANDAARLFYYLAEQQREAEQQLPFSMQTAAGATINIPPTPLPARSRPLHPTQIYSAINAGLLGWFLWSYYPARRRDGEVIALMLTFYPVARFLLEVIRNDEGAFGPTTMTISQNGSLLLLIAAAGLWAYLWRQPRRRAGEFSDF